jgi:hypothetical protein
VVDDDGGAVAGEREGNASADTVLTTGAGNDGDLALEAESVDGHDKEGWL